MNSKIKKMIAEGVQRSLNEKRRYMKSRNVVEQMVREELKQYINESDETRNLDALKNPAINAQKMAQQTPQQNYQPKRNVNRISKISNSKFTPSNGNLRNNLSSLANGETINEYENVRNVVEQMVREELTSQLNEKKNKEANQLQQLLSDPTLDLAQIAYQNDVPGGTEDGQRSWLSKVARGKITPKHKLANKIIHSIVSGTQA